MADDPAMVRERLAYPIYAARGVPAPRVMHCRVVENAAYPGLYLLGERINKEFVTKRFGKDTVNQLYRRTEMHPDVDYDPSWPDAEYAQSPSDPGVGVGSMWEARIESLPAYAANVRALVRLVNTDPAAARTLIDVNLFIQGMAVGAATGETDGYIGNNRTHPDEFYTGNLFLYRNPRTGRHLLAVWDRDQSFWQGPRLPSDPSTYDDSITFGFDRRILTRNLILSDAAGLAPYRQGAARDRRGPHAAGRAERPSRHDFRADSGRGVCRHEPAVHPSNEALVQEWNDELRPRFQRRYDDVLNQLASP